MKHYKEIMIVIFVIAMFCLVSSCGETECENGSCGIDILSSFSACGGFDNDTKAKFKEAGEDEECDEKLIWSYDESSGTLSILNEFVNLNCCGDHSIKVEKNPDGGYIIKEKDQPEPGHGGARCMCNCFFDFKVDILNVTDGIIPIRFTRQVTDSKTGNEVLIWKGSLDLSTNSGAVVVQEHEYCQLS